VKEGYSYVPGSNNNKVTTPDGEVITRRQYRNIEAQERGAANYESELRAKRETSARDLGISRKEYQSLRRSDAYKGMLHNFKREHPDYKKNPLGGDFDRRFYAFTHDKSATDPTTGEPAPDNTPAGPRARFLVDIGLRNSDWGWDVGETEKMLAQQRGSI